MEELLTIAQLKQVASADKVETRIHAQVEAISQKTTQTQKPYFEVVIADSEARLTLRAWSDTPAFAQCHQLQRGQFVEVEGEFTSSPAFGVDAKRWSYRMLDPEERQALLAGPVELREKQAAFWSGIVAAVDSIVDPRLRTLCEDFLRDHGDRFQRTAAARNYHHARRGGLVEHTGQMMNAALALCGVYDTINRDLVIAGVLFHDCGKLWENTLPENGFTMAFDELGELLGHISIGIELVNSLWRKLPLEQWRTIDPASEDVRRHLLHLIAAHHGSREFGSPVEPKTPEAWLLHYVDNLDAKLEMMSAGYTTANKLAPRIFERVRPLNTNLVLPLAHVTPDPAPDPNPELASQPVE